MKKQPQEHAPRSQQKKRHPVLWIILSLLLIGFIFCAVNVIRALMQPTSVFAKNAATPIPESTVMAPAFPIATTTPDPDAPTADPANASPATPEPAVPVSAAPAIPEADTSNRLNVMLMGIDAKENGGTTSGSMPHTDVMMVIAINFDEKTVDLITLPRDTLTTAPGYYGYYKLNGVFNVGLGGWKKPTGQADELADGFLLTCRAAEQWLGGISIPYYYAVDFQAVINIVDAIGGIDYDVDQQFNAFNSNKTYHTGMQHLDGDAVMGYLRIRNGADGLDSSRTARQRKMMVAIFNKLKSEGTLSMIPSLITAANSGIYTNTTLIQTTSLASYATKLNTDSIRTRSMFGEISDIEYDWRYVYVDQQNRIDLIREVFGIEVGPVGTCTRQYERWLHTVGFAAMKYMRQAEKVLIHVQEKKDAGETFTDEQIALYSDCYVAYTALREGFDQATDRLAARYAAAPWREKKNSQKSWTAENKAADQELTALEAEIKQNINSLQTAVKETTLRLAESIDHRYLTWTISTKWYMDQDINEVIVAFG
jgi:LCP family protein required for cell wall assembly